MIIKRILFAAAAAILLISVSASAQTKLLRFPDVHGDKVVFTYGGDLWTASSSGGTATRLTAHPGVEVFGKFSPDGKWIAFTGQYDGDEQVYVISASGGEPKQLTFYPARGPLTPRWGYDNQVYGWTNDGKSVVFKSLRDSWTLPVARLYTVPATGGPAIPLPMPEAGSGALLAAIARLQNRETLRRRTGKPALYFRSQNARCEKDQRQPAPEPRSDVDRQHHLLQFRS